MRIMGTEGNLDGKQKLVGKYLSIWYEMFKVGVDEGQSGLSLHMLC